MRAKALSITILFLTSILSIWINGAFIEESKSHELVENPMQYEVQGQSHPSGFQSGHANQNVTLSLGFSHACAILENNTMTCWGETWDGAQGMYDGTADSGFNVNWDPTWSTAWPENGVASVSAGYHITCAILTNTSTYCLGNGSIGTIGNGATSGDYESIQYVDFGPGRYAVAIEAASYSISCALLDNGDVACWGEYVSPNGDSPTPVVVDLENRKAVGISVMLLNACAVLEDGGVMCWGESTGQSWGSSFLGDPVNSTAFQGHDVVGLNAGDDAVCGLLRNGSVACEVGGSLYWVGLPAGKTAISVAVSDEIDWMADGTGWVAGPASGCVLLSDKSINCWGHASGNDTANSPSMADPMLTEFSSGVEVLAIAKSSNPDPTTCALLNNSEIQCWGNNEYAQVGDAYGGEVDANDRLLPTKMVIASLDSSYWDWDAAVAPFAADDRDRDGDGVLNIFDKCLNTPIGSTIDQDGCIVASSSDDDGDGVDNSADLCPNTPSGETVDANGCAQSQLDDDSDGVMNDADLCPNTPSGETVDANGCAQSQLDDDGDGVMNDADLCPGTAAGASVNTDGCSIAQLDADGDGVSDLLDNCPNTPAGETVDIYGCSDSQLDDDGDGVMNDADLCPNTPAGETVDAVGCAQSQLDDDSDGVMNDADLCPGTAAGETVDTNGCSDSQLDDDGDGVMNDADLCPGTAAGETVDANGCAQSQLDDDGDGVPDIIDQCPGTPSGVTVGADGCNYPPVCDISYDDGIGNIVSLQSQLSMGTGTSSSSLSLPTGTYEFILECTDPESDMLTMTVTIDGGSGIVFTGSPLSTGGISVPVQDGMTLSKTITYYWTDGSNVGTYEIDVSLIGDDTADPDTGWAPGFELWITLLAIVASLFFNRTRKVI